MKRTLPQHGHTTSTTPRRPHCSHTTSTTYKKHTGTLEGKYTPPARPHLYHTTAIRVNLGMPHHQHAHITTTVTPQPHHHRRHTRGRPYCCHKPKHKDKRGLHQSESWMGSPNLRHNTTTHRCKRATTNHSAYMIWQVMKTGYLTSVLPTHEFTELALKTVITKSFNLTPRGIFYSFTVSFASWFM